MKWIIITTSINNPGDLFAALGAKKIIQAVDDDPDIFFLNKENPEHYKEREFDRCIYASMPLFWSMPGNECQDIVWWESLLRGWPTKDKNKFMVLGSGSLYVDEIHNTRRYVSSIMEMMKRSWVVTTRNTVLSHPAIVDSVCPAAFAIPERKPGGPRVCNLMLSGGHFPYNTFEMDQWASILPFIVAGLQANRFEFVAHTHEEWLYAQKLGWEKSRIHVFRTPQEYLDCYATAEAYFGNRLHGGAVCVSVGIPTICVAYDSRLQFVQRLGALAVRPSQLDQNVLQAWFQNPRHLASPMIDKEKEFSRLRQLVLDFKNQC